MAAVTEKQVPRMASYSAIAAATLLSGVFWVLGARKPDTWATGMAVNHHLNYGQTATCYQCHVPQGAFTTQVGCFTGSCHGSIKPGQDLKAAIDLYKNEKEFSPDIEERGKHVVELHASVKNEDCMSCHTEHTTRPTKVPPGWDYWATIKARKEAHQQSSVLVEGARELAWVSVLGRENSQK